MPHEANESVHTKPSNFVVFYGPEEKDPAQRAARGVSLVPVERASEFDVETPITNHVYVPSEADPRRLYLFARYEDEVIADVFREGLRIVTMLGASRVHSFVWKDSGTESKGGGRIGFGRGSALPQVSAETNLSKSEGWDAMYDMEGAGGPPTDPRPLKFPNFPGFDAACDAVLRNGAKRIHLTIEQRTRLALDGEIAATLKAAGFKLGASSSSSRNTAYVIRAEFPEGHGGRPGILGRGRTS